MPTISNLQGNLRLSSGVFEIVQGTGIIPRLYTSSTVAPQSIVSGLSLKVNPYTTPWSKITGYELGLKFASDLDLRYHLQNQYWLFLTGQSPSGPFSIYSGTEGIQSNSTGLSVLRSNLPTTFYPKVLVLPLDLESKLGKMFNSGSYALAQNDKINFGLIDFPSERVNISGNILLRNQDPERYIRFSRKNGGVVDININSDESVKGSPNVLIGQGNYLPYFYSGADGKYPDSNYLIGRDNVIEGSGSVFGAATQTLLYGNQNASSGSNDVQLFGKLNKVYSGQRIIVQGAYNTLTNSSDVVVLGKSAEIKNALKVLLVGESNQIDKQTSKVNNLVSMGRNNSFAIPSGVTNPVEVLDLLLVGNDQYIYASGLSDTTLIGRNNVINTNTNAIYEAKDISIYGNNNRLSGYGCSVNLFGDFNKNINTIDLTYVGDLNAISGASTSSIIGSVNSASSIDSATIIGDNNVVYNAFNILSLGDYNQIGAGSDGQGFAWVDSILVPSGQTKNFTITGAVAIGSTNRVGVNNSLAIGLGNENYPTSGNPSSGANSIVLGNFNLSSGSRNLIIGAYSKVTGMRYSPNASNISLGYSNSIGFSDNIISIGNNNSISSTSGAGFVENTSNFILGTDNYFRNSSNNIALGVGNYFFNETGKFKVSLPNGASFSLSKTTADFGEATIKAGNLKIDVNNETANLSERLSKIEQSRLLERFDSTDSSIFATAISGSSSTFSLSNRIYSDEFETIKMPAQIELSSCNTGLSGTIATGIYDLYYLPTYGKFTTLGAVNTVVPTGGKAYSDFVSGKAPFVELRRASAVYDFIRKENITYGSPSFPWKVSYPYYFYAKFEAPNRYAIISYTSAFTSGITSYNTGNVDYTGECSKFKGLWALYTGTGYQYDSYNSKNRPVLINTYRSGQFSGWKYGDESYLNPNEIPLYGWYGSGSWIESGIGQKLISGFGTFPTAPIGNSPCTLKPIVDLKRIRFMSVALGYENNIDQIPGAFIPIYY